MNAKAFGGLAASEDFVSRIGSIGRWQAAPPFGTGLFQRALVLNGSRILFAGYPLCWALWYGKASRPFFCCGMVLVLAELRCFVPSSCSSIAVKTAANVRRRPNKPR